MKKKTEQVKTTIDSQDDLASVKYLILASIISADNDKYTEYVKQLVIHRYNVCKDTGGYMDWAYIFQPLGDDAAKYTELFRGA